LLIRQNQPNGPTTPHTQRLPAITRIWFGLFRFRSPRQLIVRGTAPKDLRKPLPVKPAQVRPVSPQSSPEPAQPGQASAPRTLPHDQILIPKLRIKFAAFPYLHSSMDQRLITLGT